MGFALPDDAVNTAAALRTLEPQAPKSLKAVMIQAATELDDLRRFVSDAAIELEAAAALRIGQMDSQSRADEVSRAVRLTLNSVAARARQLLSGP